MNNRIFLLLGCAVLTTAVPAACTGPAAMQGFPLASLASLESASIDDAEKHAWITLEDQPTADELERAKQAGVKTVINLRPEREHPDFDERSVVTGLGMRYENLPFGSAVELTDDLIEQSRALLRDADRPILLHCKSANRVGAIWAAYLSLDEGLTWDAAIAEGKAAGLRSPALEKRVREYVAAHRAPPPPRPIAKPEPPAPGAVEMNDRERAFQAMLTGAELIGHFTLDGAAADAPLREERYSIASVTKVRNNLWRFECRIRYGANDVTVPIVLAVAWAGNTPVIGVTDLNVPGLGTYTARVLFFRDKYAGTWSGKNYGGHLFGRIERPEAE